VKKRRKKTKLRRNLILLARCKGKRMKALSILLSAAVAEEEKKGGWREVFLSARRKGRGERDVRWKEGEKWHLSSKFRGERKSGTSSSFARDGKSVRALPPGISKRKERKRNLLPNSTASRRSGGKEGKRDAGALLCAMVSERGGNVLL